LAWCFWVNLQAWAGSLPLPFQQAAIVKALAQIEMIFAFSSSVFFVKERINVTELAGCLLIVAGIVALVMFG